ncbi:MAG: type II secretion system F family protein [Patescibacteria group bacterium]
MLYTFTAKNESGNLTEGKRESADKTSLSQELRAENLILVVARETAGNLDLSAVNHFFTRITLHEKIIFTRNLAAMLSAGISLSRVLGILSRQTQNFKFKKTLDSLLDDINKGQSLSEGMKKFPKVFSSLFVSMIKSGEESGGLPNSLKSVGVQLEKNYTMNRKIRGALMYPAIVITAIFVIGILMLIYVVPTLTATFKDLGAELPKSTQLVIAFSDFLVLHTVTFIISTVFVLTSLFYFIRTRYGARAYQFVMLHFPLFGPIIKEINAARTARTLSSLLSSGVDMRESLVITGGVLQNVFYKEVLEKAEIDVEKGLPLSGLFKERTDLYPVMVGEMMEVGEETGKLSDMLENIADFYESEVDATTKDLSTLIEPLMMIMVGAAVGFFAVAMISPTYSVLNSI